MKKVFLFDLDGTLLPMDQDLFMKVYFGALVEKFSSILKPEITMGGMNAGVKAMLKNDGSKTNEEVFWKSFEEVTQCTSEDVQHLIEDFYLNDFKKTKMACQTSPISKKLIDVLKEKGVRLICATNPLFPRTATLQRLAWAGLNEDDFEFVTTYEDSRFCKPNPMYYETILKQVGVDAKDTLMVGNDLHDDGIVAKLGIDFAIITDCLLDQGVEECPFVFKGTLNDFHQYILID